MFKRRVFYLSGFDPRGGRFYHALHQEQLAKHAALTGETITISERKRVGGKCVDWTVANATAQAETQFSFLQWDDLIRKSWITDPLLLGWKTISAYCAILCYGDLRAAWKHDKVRLIALFYPPLAVLLLPLLAALLIALPLLLVLEWWVALPLGLVAGVLLTRGFLIRLRVFWLIRLFIHNHEIARRGFDPTLDQRLDQFAQSMSAALDVGHDEVLLIAHSNGAILAVPLLVIVRIILDNIRETRPLATLISNR